MPRDEGVTLEKIGELISAAVTAQEQYRSRYDDANRAHAEMNNAADAACRQWDEIFMYLVDYCTKMQRASGGITRSKLFKAIMSKGEGK